MSIYPSDGGTQEAASATPGHPVDVHAILVDGQGRILLSRRGPNCAYAPNLWHLPSGKVERDEPVLHAAIRESAEELAITIEPQALTCVLAMQHRGPGARPRIGFFFTCHRWDGSPVNAEPDKCSGLRWSALSDLPEGMVAYTRAGLDAWQAGLPFAVHWQPDSGTIAHTGDTRLDTAIRSL